MPRNVTMVGEIVCVCVDGKRRLRSRSQFPSTEHFSREEEGMRYIYWRRRRRRRSSSSRISRGFRGLKKEEQMRPGEVIS